MIFTDWKFFVFFAITFAIYWLIPGKTGRKLWLLLCSAVFYAFWDWRFLFLILLVVANTYVTGLALARIKERAWRKRILTIGVAVSLTVLGFFKYFDFFRLSIKNLLSALDVSVPSTTLTVLLPIGISFYTFHSLSYMGDVYRGKVPATYNILDIAMYILFFPQLVAGPILRATDFLPQLREPKRFETIDWRGALALFLIGYIKKACIADNLSPLVDPIFANPQLYGSGDAVIAVLSYTVQIYCDFSGYTDMAIATSAMLGYRLPPNFAHPYLAMNLGDFWRRWHISLSSWLRDYLYIPLGGSRYGKLATNRNLMITMLLGGLWHGASWTFVFWGALHGIGLVVHHAYAAAVELRRRPNSLILSSIFSVMSILTTFLWVSCAWIFFRASTFEHAAGVFNAFTRLSPPTLMSWQWFALLMSALIVAHVTTYRIKLEGIANGLRDWLFALLYGSAVAMALPFVNVKVVPFIYFQF
jgi:alginate O-acetyltransferase complex protein AlgI